VAPPAIISGLWAWQSHTTSSAGTHTTNLRTCYSRPMTDNSEDASRSDGNDAGNLGSEHVHDPSEDDSPASAVASFWKGASKSYRWFTAFFGRGSQPS
jgi:hypothetical protein